MNNNESKEELWSIVFVGYSKQVIDSRSLTHAACGGAQVAAGCKLVERASPAPVSIFFLSAFSIEKEHC